jgi:cytochrome c-type biogenesis protein CcmH/NrfF
MGDFQGPPGPDTAAGPAPEAEQAPPRAAAAVVVGGVILIALVAYAFHRRNTATAPPPAPAPAAADAPAELSGTPITAVSLKLSPEAAIATERYRCVCSCNDPLSVCTCTQIPGSIDMKRTVQELVDQKKTPAEMDAAMVAKYGEAVLLSNPPAAPPGRTPAGSRSPTGDR